MPVACFTMKMPTSTEYWHFRPQSRIWKSCSGFGAKGYWGRSGV